MKSLPCLLPEQFCTVFMSTAVNEVRLHDDPPLIPVDYEQEHRRQQAEDGIKMDARRWDYYRDVVQLSLHHQGQFRHFMLCQEIDWKPDQKVIRRGDNSVINLYDSERDLMLDFFWYFREVFGPETQQGCPLYDRLLVGHLMLTEIWPVLVNKALKYRIPMYRDMRSNPDTRYSTVQHVADISSIYLQGGAPLRRAPSLPNLLRTWGFHDEHRPLPEDIADAVCDDPEGTALYIESYLKDIHEVLCLYYQVNTNEQAAGEPVPVSVPQWVGQNG